MREHVADFAVSRFVYSIVPELGSMLLGSMVAGVAFALIGAYVTRRLLFLRSSGGGGGGGVGASGGGAHREPMPHMELSLVATVAFFT